MLTFASIGGMNVLVPDPRDISRLVATMQRTRVTAMSGVNTLFNALVHSQEFAALDFSALKIAIGGGAAVQSAVAEHWHAITGTNLVEGYGLTEGSPVICINPLADPHIGTVGLPVPSTEVSIRDDHGQPVAPNEMGEVWVHGPQVMQGYWDRPDESRKVLTADGWLKTGDIGTIDAQGFVKLLDRKKDMIIVSGFKVFPNEVEDVVAQHPGVLEAAVIGVPDERTGQLVKLFVVRRDPELTEETLRAYCRENLTGYKVPRVIEFRDTLPKSNIGKILRKELR
jgi:long-chain acyl-CoA synthetase